MLELLSSLDSINHLELTASSWVLASGVSGTFVALNGATAEKPTAGAFALPIWTESNRNQTAGFSPDVSGTGNVTVLNGKVRFKTDQFEAGVAVGEALKVSATGTLTTATVGGSDVVVGFVKQAAHTHTYLGTQYTVIEVLTV